MADLARQVEHSLATVYQALHRQHITHIDRANRHVTTVFHWFDIERIATCLGDQCIHEEHISAKIEQSDGKVGPDKPQAAGDQYAFAGIAGEVRLRVRVGRVWQHGIAPGNK